MSHPVHRPALLNDVDESNAKFIQILCCDRLHKLLGNVSVDIIQNDNDDDGVKLVIQ